jgi:hypothetical protein
MGQLNIDDRSLGLGEVLDVVGRHTDADAATEAPNEDAPVTVMISIDPHTREVQLHRLGLYVQPFRRDMILACGRLRRNAIVEDGHSSVRADASRFDLKPAFRAAAMARRTADSVKGNGFVI